MSLIHLFLSAHLDDVVLSCGGLLHHHLRHGDRVVAVTLCAGDAPSGLLSPLAEELHTRWSETWGGSTTGVVARRRAEDLAALSALGAETIHLELPDAIYRRSPASRGFLYASRNALFGALHPEESRLPRRLAEQIKPLLRGFGRHQLYLPLALGNHVDHQLARQVGELAGRPFAYYEDYPYASGEAGLGPAPANGPTLTAPNGRPLSAHFVTINEDDLFLKIRAIAHYRSQLTSFWPDETAMAAAVRRFAEQTASATGGLAERLWRVV
jgi:LmbE family N-acetylglucosaminyl deacetylase